MKLEHIAIWSNDIERLRAFYMTYFAAKSNDGYYNSKKRFRSYFLTFDDGARLEIMNKEGLGESVDHDGEYLGYCHLAMDVGSRNEVVGLTERLEKDGFVVVSQPRTTGDGYFESVVLDPDGNKIEITG